MKLLEWTSDDEVYSLRLFGVKLVVFWEDNDGQGHYGWAWSISTRITGPTLVNDLAKAKLDCMTTAYRQSSELATRLREELYPHETVSTHVVSDDGKVRTYQFSGSLASDSPERRAEFWDKYQEAKLEAKERGGGLNACLLRRGMSRLPGTVFIHKVDFNAEQHAEQDAVSRRSAGSGAGSVHKAAAGNSIHNIPGHETHGADAEPDRVPGDNPPARADDGSAGISLDGLLPSFRGLMFARRYPPEPKARRWSVRVDDRGGGDWTVYLDV